MKFIGALGLLSAAAMFVQALSITREPTHIIKFKGQVNLNNESGKLLLHLIIECYIILLIETVMMCYLAAQFLTSQFKEFVAGAVLEDHILSSSFDTASLTTISLNEDFHAVSGVFHERFAQFLKNRGDIEYIEKNEIYKAVRVLPPAQSPGLQKRSVEKYQTPSWGLARIFHRENTDLNNYEVENGNG
jgi:hypothetical protein